VLVERCIGEKRLNGVLSLCAKLVSFNLVVVILFISSAFFVLFFE